MKSEGFQRLILATSFSSIDQDWWFLYIFLFGFDLINKRFSLKVCTYSVVYFLHKTTLHFTVPDGHTVFAPGPSRQPYSSLQNKFVEQSQLKRFR